MCNFYINLNKVSDILMYYHHSHLASLQGRLQVSGKGGAGDLVQAFKKNGGLNRILPRDNPPPFHYGLVFPGADPGFQIIGGALKKFRRA